VTGHTVRWGSTTDSSGISVADRIAESLERQAEQLRRLADHFDPPPADIVDFERQYGWHRLETIIDNKASGKKTKPQRTECLWTNYCITTDIAANHLNG
jgi:hypothetical protein